MALGAWSYAISCEGTKDPGTKDAKDPRTRRTKDGPRPKAEGPRTFETLQAISDMSSYNFFKRARGALLRLVRRRPIAVLVGVAVAGPAAWLELSGRYDAWWIDGLSLILVATGLALIWSGVVGITPDWIDSERE